MHNYYSTTAALLMFACSASTDENTINVAPEMAEMEIRNLDVDVPDAKPMPDLTVRSSPGSYSGTDRSYLGSQIDPYTYDKPTVKPDGGR